MKPRRERQEQALGDLSRKCHALETDRKHNPAYIRVGRGIFGARYVDPRNYPEWLRLAREAESLRQRMDREHFELTG